MIQPLEFGAARRRSACGRDHLQPEGPPCPRRRRFVKTAGQFDAEVWVRKNGTEVPGSDIRSC